MVPADDLAQVLGRRLGHPVDVSRQRNDVLGDPCRRVSGQRCERAAEDAGGAREHEAPDPGRDRLLQERQRPRDVGVHESALLVRPDVRLVERRHMKDRVHPGETPADDVAVADRPGHGCER